MKVGLEFGLKNKNLRERRERKPLPHKNRERNSRIMGERQSLNDQGNLLIKMQENCRIFESQWMVEVGVCQEVFESCLGQEDHILTP